jgi:hypothetical protein
MKGPGNCKRRLLVVFQGDFLGQHHVPDGQVFAGHKTPASYRMLEAVQLVDIGREIGPNPVTPASMTA